MTQVIPVQDVIMARSNCCKLLAACFHEPEKDLFLEEKVHEHLLELMHTLVPEVAKEAAVLRDAFASAPQEQLSVEYAALFVGPFELLAPPYGSVYLEKGYRVQGDSTIAVHKFYERHGFTLDIQEPADHLAVELEFLSHLAALEAQAVQDDDHRLALLQQEVQTEFFTSYMSWLPAFGDRLVKGATSEYYRTLGTVFQAFYACCQTVYAR